jgi:hypothetical protein
MLGFSPERKPLYVMHAGGFRGLSRVRHPLPAGMLDPYYHTHTSHTPIHTTPLLFGSMPLAHR